MEPDVSTEAGTNLGTELDLDTVERDLAGVEAALERLDRGTYFTDEVTGAPLPESFLAANPTARTVTGPTTA